MNIGLYFGSFNPIHVGHLIIASYVFENTNLDKIWFVVSPHNPLKEEKSLLNEHHRLYLVDLAIKDDNRFRVSNIEFNLPKPSYTVHTLAYLQEKFPLEKFHIVLGGDSYYNIKHWKNYEFILKNYPLIVFKRPGFEVSPLDNSQTTILNAPLLQISATEIREMIKNNKSIKYMVPESVEKYIEENNYYK